MLIRSKAERPAGYSVHEIEGKVYRFAPMAGVDGHVADVVNQAHIARFLSMPTVFEIHDADPATAPVDDDAPLSDTAPRHVARPPTDDPAANTPEPADQDTADDDPDEHARLAKEYAKLNNRPAPPKIKTETLRQKVAELAAIKQQLDGDVTPS